MDKIISGIFDRFVKSSCIVIRQLIALFFVLLLLSPCITISGQSPYFRNINIDEGLPGSTVYSMMQDSLGYLWFATDRGLCRYDGDNFQVFDDGALKGNEVLEIFSIDNEIWMPDYSGGLYYLKDNKVTPFESKILENDHSLKFFFKGPRNDYWISSVSGFLYKLKKNAPFDYEIEEIFELEAFSKFYTSVNGKKELLIFIDNKRMAYNFNYNKKEFKKIQLKEVILDYPVLDFGTNLNTLLSSQEKDELSYQTDSLKKFVLENLEILTGPPISLFVDSNNSKFALSRHELFHIDDELNLGPSAVWAPFLINKISKDQEGNFWIMTKGKGLFVLYKSSFTLFNMSNSKLPNNYIHELEVYQDTILLIGSAKGWLSILEKNKFSNFQIFKTNKEFYHIALSQDYLIAHAIEQFRFNLNTKKITQLSELGKASYIDSHNKTRYNASYEGLSIVVNELAQFRIPFYATYAFCRDRYSDKLFLGTTKGLYYYDTALPFTEYDYNAISNKDVLDSQFSFEVNSTKNDSKIIKYRNYEKSPIQIYKDIKGDSIDFYVSAFAQGKDSTLYLATHGGGVYYLKDQQIYQITKKDGLTSDFCTDITLDQDEEVWVTTNAGLNRIDKKGKIQKITSEDGLSSNETNTVASIGDKIYVGTSRGLTSFEKSRLEKNQKQLNTIIEGVQIMGRDTIVYSNYKLPHDKNSFNISYKAISFRSKVKYQYRMLGLDNKWIDTDQKLIRFQKLKPAKYTFEVRATTKDQLDNSPKLQIHFEIRPPWWQTIWAQLGAGLLLLMILGIVLSRVISSIRKNEATKSALNKRMGDLELNALRAQMNPHFIFNVMNSIQSYIVDEDSYNASIYLDKFASLMRSFLEASKNNLISLRDELTMLKLYTELEEMRFENGFTTIFKIDDKINQDVKIPSIIVQPFVENAIKHGLTLKKNGLLKISFIQEGSSIICKVIDNGIGREPTKLLKAKSYKHQSRGFDLINERVTIINQSERSKIEIDIQDLKDEHGKALGTLVKIEIPLLNKYKK